MPVFQVALSRLFAGYALTFALAACLEERVSRLVRLVRLVRRYDRCVGVLSLFFCRKRVKKDGLDLWSVLGDLLSF